MKVTSILTSSPANQRLAVTMPNNFSFDFDDKYGLGQGAMRVRTMYTVNTGSKIIGNDLLLLLPKFFDT
jgi:hypothetical protein